MTLPRMIVGLGNPGRKYEHTRHNIGFDLLDHLAAEYGLAFKSDLKSQSQLARLATGPFLVKPQTFMNNSGRSAGQLARFYKLKPQEILMVYDDTDLALGSLRFREKGSAGGHNGVKSMIAHLGTNEIPRLKIGVGKSMPGEQVGHVLGKFAPNEREEVQNTLATAVQAVQLALSQGCLAAANAYNTRKKIEESQTDEQEIRRTDRSEHEG